MTTIDAVILAARQVACQHRSMRHGYDWSACDQCGFSRGKNDIGTDQEIALRALRRSIHEHDLTLTEVTA